jgi:hypothetical protein
VERNIAHHTKASDELLAAADAIRASAMSGAAEIADLLEATARRVTVRESMWELVGHSEQQQMQLAEWEWRRELAMARALASSARKPSVCPLSWLFAGHRRRHHNGRRCSMVGRTRVVSRR